MAAKTVLVIWTLAQELVSPSTRALTESAQHALGSEVSVEVQALPEGVTTPPIDASSPAVRLSWIGTDHASARVACFVPRLGRWVEREVRFEAADPETERGRTLGFVVASMLIDQAALRRASPEVELESKPEPEPPRESKRQSPEAGFLRPATRPPRQRVQERAPRPTSMAIAAAAAAAGPGDAMGFGAWLGTDWSLGSGVWMGLAFEGRVGSIPAAQATSLMLGLGAGLLWSFWRPNAHTWIGARGATSVVRVAVTHLSTDEGGEAEQARFTPAFELSLLGGYQLTPGSALYLELGSHFFAGRTDIFVDGIREARLPFVVPLGRLGVRTGF